MMYSWAPASRGSTVVAKKRTGKSVRIDLHCHYANTEAMARAAARTPGQDEPTAKHANADTRAPALPRDTNAKQRRERAPKLSSIEVRLKDMARMGIATQAVSPAPHQT